MSEPKHTIRIRMTDVFPEGKFVAMRDVRDACEKNNITMEIVEEKYFDFTTDDIRNFFFLGLNFPKA